MTGLDVVFLDEPTIHLDAGIRAALADQIGRIKGLSQLGVISHDDTFERITEHVVTIEKGNERISSVARDFPEKRQNVLPMPEASGDASGEPSRKSGRRKSRAAIKNTPDSQEQSIPTALYAAAPGR